MGSKVSTKMAAPTARVIQAIRPRAPLIKFPDRLGVPKPNALEALKAMPVTLPQHGSSLSGTTAAALARPAAPFAALARPAAPFAGLPGSPDTLASIQLVPQRYRRRPLVAEEMDYIQRGGPE